MHNPDILEPEFGSFVGEKNESQVLQLEFPILYYAVSILYRLFGYHEFLYRLLNIIIGLLGLYALFKTSVLFLKDKLHSWTIPIYLFTSIIFVFYISNFIPDATALAVALMGFYQFVKFIFNDKLKYFIFSILFFTIAGLLKVQSLLLFFSILGLYFLEVIFKIRLHKDKKLFSKPLKYLPIFLFCLISVIGYYLYAKWYSDTHQSFTSIRLSRSGIWNYDRETIAEIWDLFYRRFKNAYFHSPKFIYLVGLIIIHNIIFIKKYNRVLNIISYLTFFQGFIVFNLVFFFSIGRCDYYQINNLIFIILLM
ncbi:MAG: glycosyltransferase family 39 protein, partial [Salinivirgaceae bacterium]|nr:glycosyltransferase family 39 protein [Salinivirgaceae bacterium]